MLTFVCFPFKQRQQASSVEPVHSATQLICVYSFSLRYFQNIYCKKSENLHFLRVSSF